MTRCVPIDEAVVFEVFEAVESDNGKINCPNGCYDPIDATVKAIRAAVTLHRCGECGSVNLLEWDGDEVDEEVLE